MFKRPAIRYGDTPVAKETGQSVEPAKLIAPMLARFMATDRAFVRGRSKG